jgi:membrane peptidoglycan carboxypeptidase
MKIIQLTIIALFLTASSAFAQYNQLIKTNQEAMSMQTALQELMLKQGEITREDYNNFWSKVNANSFQEKQRLISLIRKNFILIQEYNREMWNCAESAWYSSKINTCTKAQEILTGLKKDAKMKEQLDLFNTIEENLNNVIKAAANKNEIKGKDGTSLGKITIEAIKNSRNNIDKILARFDRILSVEYVEGK